MCRHFCTLHACVYVCKINLCMQAYIYAYIRTCARTHTRTHTLRPPARYLAKQYNNLLLPLSYQQNAPSLTTIRLAMASGTLVPAAINVRAITVSGMLNVWPTTRHTYQLHKRFFPPHEIMVIKQVKKNVGSTLKYWLVSIMCRNVTEAFNNYENMYLKQITRNIYTSDVVTFHNVLVS